MDSYYFSFANDTVLDEKKNRFSEFGDELQEFALQIGSIRD
jgi:hypothetical protein